MDLNSVLSINQTVHNMGAVVFGAGPFYFLLLLYKRKRIAGSLVNPADMVIEAAFSTAVTAWLFFLALQALSGASFGLISLVYEGALPEMAPVAKTALGVKVIGAFFAFVISLYIRFSIVPGLKRITEGAAGKEHLALLALRKKRAAFVWILFFLAVIILTGAAFLRWNI